MVDYNLSLHQLVKALTLMNAVKYGGRAEKKPILNKILSRRADLRKRIGEIMPLLEETIREVNTLTIEEQINLLKDFPEFVSSERPEVVEKALTPLPNAQKGEVVTRFSPNPDFVLHLGSARAAILSHDYARMYEGKFILRFEDTDPRTKKPEERYYSLIRQDLKWLSCSWDEEYIQSQRLEIYYEVARKLLEKNAAYICTCEREAFRASSLNKRPCPHRDFPPPEQVNRFEEMLEGRYREGEAVLRVKTDLNHPNPALRDWPSLRVIDTSRYPHPLTGRRHKVWPLYNFSCAIDDHFMEITHVIRGVEHEVNELRQQYLYDYMGWTPPTAIHHGRLSIPTGVLSKSKMLMGIEEGVYSGFDDPRLATLTSLRKKGFQPEAIRRVVHEVGVRPSLAVIEWSNLEAYNRKIIDISAHRRFVVLNPFKLRIRDIHKSIHVEIRLHPDHKEKRVRSFTLPLSEGTVEVYIEKNDFEAYKNAEIVRLMGLANIRFDGLEETEGRAHLIDYAVSTALESKAPIIHWVPLHENVETNILWSDASTVVGIGEQGLLEEKVGCVIQMERVGFARVDDVDASRISLIYTHK